MSEKEKGFVKPAPKPADTEVEYVGMQTKVRIPEWKDQWIEQGETIEVSAQLAERLVEQPANWKLVTQAAQKAAKEEPNKGSDDDEPAGETPPEEE